MKKYIFTFTPFFSFVNTCETRIKILRFLTIFIFLVIINIAPNSDNCLCQQSAWYAQQTGTTQTLWSIFFINEYTGWVVGSGGILLKTNNGGDNWLQYSTGTTNQLNSIQFINSQTGFIAGSNGIFKKSTNGGLNWQTINTGNQVNLWQCFFVNSELGFIASNNSIMRSTNGGLNWIYSLQTSYYYGIFFYNANYGWTMSQDGQYYVTSNGGNNWIPTSFNSAGGGISFSFINLTTGWVVGYQNAIYKTTNGGYNWNIQQFNPMTGPILRSVCFPDATGQQGWIVGDNGVFIKTNNSGSNWIIEDVNHSINYKCIVFAGQNKGWVSGSNGIILHTTNGGISPPPAPTLVSPANNSTENSVTPTMIWNSVVGAANYKIQISTVANFLVVSDSATISNTQYIVPSGKLLNGYTYFWRVNASNTLGTSAWSSVWSFSTALLPPAPILISPSNGTIGTTTTPTLIWSNLSDIINYKVQISRVPNFTLIIDSTSVDTNRYTVPSGKLFDNITYFWRVNASNNFGTGPWSQVWSFTPQPTNFRLIGSGLPTETKLYNNYPNPFNPVTKIRFDVSKAGLVNLRVFNIQGKEVAILMNTMLPAGSYETMLNASSFSSGVYYYRIQTSEINFTKSMILLK